MNDNRTDLIILVDRSGSMSSVVEETVAGTNRYFHEQREIPGECFIHLYRFDNEWERVLQGVNLVGLADISRQDIEPRGWTALFDAIAATISDMGNYYRALPEGQRPSKVLMVILTDGEENSSKEFRAHQVKEMIKHQTDKYNWQVTFIGANQDAVLAGDTVGIGLGQSLNFAANARGVGNAYTSISSATSRFRKGDKTSNVDTDGNLVQMDFGYTIAEQAVGVEDTSTHE